jgi:hypothetical protein
MDSKIFYQGEVQVNGSTKIVCTTNRLIILNIVINNLTSPYTFTLNRYTQKVDVNQKNSLKEVPLYKLLLEEGDSIRDNTEYILETGDYIQLISDVPDTVFYINAIQL